MRGVSVAQISVPCAALVLDFRVDTAGESLDADGEGATGVAAGGVRAGVSGQFTNEEHRVIGCRASAKHVGHECARFPDLIQASGEGPFGAA